MKTLPLCIIVGLLMNLALSTVIVCWLPVPHEARGADAELTRTLALRNISVPSAT